MDTLSIKSAFKNRALKKLLIVTVVLLLVAVFSHFFYYRPQIDNLQQLQNQANDLRHQLLTLKALNDPANNLQALTANVKQMNQKLNYAVDTLKLSKLIHDLSKNHGIRIIRQTNSEGDEKGEWKTLKQTLTVEGGYRQLRAFIDGIYRLPSMTIIQEASLQKKSGDKKQLTGSLLLRTYQNRVDG